MKISELIELLAQVAAKEEEKKPVMVSPLQQELELMKKATGVDSYFDEELTHELDQIKKNAGITVQKDNTGGM